MRYAIYFAGPSGDKLTDLGNQWLGRNVHTGEELSQPSVVGVGPSRLAELTCEPRRYGFHGTLKAPFSLREGIGEADLLKACRSFAGEVGAFQISALAVNRLGGFLALTPVAEEKELSAFASLCVRRFDPFRGALDQNDLIRRRKSGLSARQDANLVQWGYPYIFEDFRFHMTLSGRLLDEAEAQYLKVAAEMHFQSVTEKDLIFSTFGLFVEVERGAPFQVHTIFDLSGAALPSQLDTFIEEVQ